METLLCIFSVMVLILTCIAILGGSVRAVDNFDDEFGSKAVKREQITKHPRTASVKSEASSVEGAAAIPPPKGPAAAPDRGNDALPRLRMDPKPAGGRRERFEGHEAPAAEAPGAPAQPPSPKPPLGATSPVGGASASADAVPNAYSGGEYAAVQQ